MVYLPTMDFIRKTYPALHYQDPEQILSPILESFIEVGKILSFRRDAMAEIRTRIDAVKKRWINMIKTGQVWSEFDRYEVKRIAVRFCNLGDIDQIMGMREGEETAPPEMRSALKIILENYENDGFDVQRECERTLPHPFVNAILEEVRKLTAYQKWMAGYALEEWITDWFENPERYEKSKVADAFGPGEVPPEKVARKIGTVPRHINANIPLRYQITSS